MLAERREMWLPNPKASGIRKGGGGNGLVAVAIDKNKGSQYALKWAVDCLLTRGQTVILIHVLHGTSSPVSSKFSYLSIFLFICKTGPGPC